MERFPSLERERERSSSGATPHGVKTPDYHHTAEIIFAFPSLQLHLKSEHLQSGPVPSLSGSWIDYLVILYDPDFSTFF